ncbi:MAG: AAA family ATPase [Acidibacillus sp.]|uniref:YhaN AAA domain-containing protein n=1 Tax=Sulfoacidibacillus ferrooxidans TaxID=2005001 RepID=A0A9X1V946_9BACL|nr:AAA family ATPase [Sulfoacidibacillus ferrooxidans]MCI0182368.1 hypothetical protein [Sulfoacidibacillus ferrooxidans]MCY0894638.1 AAA family ATPase [Acidibacillus sp.]
MRILQLSVPSLLHFKEYTLDLQQDSCGFHVLYGPNEAGKSTLLQVLLDMLFGGTLDGSLKDAYPASGIVLRGLLEGHDHQLVEVRRKRSRNQLKLVDTEQFSAAEIDELLAQFVSNVSRERFSLLFGFNHDRLREGGENLLRSDGQAGISLFEAGAGVTSLQHVLDNLSEQAKEITDTHSWRKNSTKKLNKSWQLYKENKELVRRASLPSKEWLRMKQEIDTLDQKNRALREHIEQLRMEEAKLQRIERVYASIGELGEVKMKRESFTDLRLPLIDEDRKRIPQLLADMQIAAKFLAEKEREHRQLVTDYEQISVHEAWLVYGHEIDTLNQRVQKYEDALDEIPMLQLQLGQMQDYTDVLLSELAVQVDGQSLEQMRIAKIDIDQMKQLSNQLNELKRDRKVLDGQLRELQEERDQVIESMRTLGNVQNITALQVVVDSMIEHGDLEQKIADKQKVIERHEVAAAKRIQQQKIWQGTAEECAKLAIPLVETREQYGQKWSRLERELIQLQQDLAKAAENYTQREHDLEEMDVVLRVPDEAELHATRAVRDRGWHLIKQVWLQDTAKDEQAIAAFSEGMPLEVAYEAAVDKADRLSDNMRQHADRVAHKAELLLQKERFEQEKKILKEKLAIMQDEFEQLQVQWVKEWDEEALVVKSPQEMKEWLSDFQDDMVNRFEVLRDLKQEHIDMVELRDSKIMDVRKAMSLFEVDMKEGYDSLKEWMTKARQIIEVMQTRARDHEQLQHQLNDRARQMMQLENKQRSCMQEIEKVEKEWAELQRLYSFVPVQIDRAMKFIDQLSDIFRHDQQVKEKERQVNSVISIREEFEQATRHIADQLHEEMQAGMNLLTFVKTMVARLRETREDHKSKNALKEQLEKSSLAIKEGKSAYEHYELQLGEWQQQYGCATETEWKILFGQWDSYDQLQSEQDSLEKQIRASGGGVPLDRLKQEVDEIPDIVLIKPRLDALVKEIAEEERHFETNAQMLGKLRGDFFQLDGTKSDAATYAQQAEFYWTVVNEEWNEYLQVELARRLLQRAIEEFRLDNESTILEQANRFFQRLTLGHYRELRVEYEDNIPYLSAVTNDGSMRRVGQMSDGTRDQLFLSLRLAFVLQHMTKEHAVPLIMDDILVHFDDARTEATLEVLAEVAQKTQVIYFTHHQSIVQAVQKLSQSHSIAVHSLVDAALPLESAQR